MHKSKVEVEVEVAGQERGVRGEIDVKK